MRVRVAYYVGGASSNGWRRSMDLFPMMVKLKGRTCVVIGAGEIAAAKIATLVACGAKVIVVAPQADESIQAQAREGKLTFHQREFVAADVDEAFLVIAATNSPAVNEEVFRACTERGVLCNVVDDPEHCDFFYPAVVNRGRLQIAISTGGQSPALAHRLRVELEQQFGPEYEAWVEEVGRRRREIMAGDLPDARRRESLENIASREAYEDFVRRGAGSAAADSAGTQGKDARHTSKS